MYDVHALNLINEAPLFGDINLDSLPKEFTDVYTEIVTVRVQLNENDNINIEELKLKLKRLPTPIFMSMASLCWAGPVKSACPMSAPSCKNTRRWG